MTTPEKLRAMAEALRKANYYEILRIPRDVDQATVQKAFHRFALAVHPDRAPEGDASLSAAAGEVFKRGVEAYRVLSRPELRARYDQGLAKGRIHFDPKAIEPPPARPKVRTLEMIAKTIDGKKHARKADRLLTAGNLEAARVELVTVQQVEPDNEEIGERLTLLWEAMSLESL